MHTTNGDCANCLRIMRFVLQEFVHVVAVNVVRPVRFIAFVIQYTFGRQCKNAGALPEIDAVEMLAQVSRNSIPQRISVFPYVYIFLVFRRWVILTSRFYILYDSPALSTFFIVTWNFQYHSLATNCPVDLLFHFLRCILRVLFRWLSEFAFLPIAIVFFDCLYFVYIILLSLLLIPLTAPRFYDEIRC